MISNSQKSKKFHKNSNRKFPSPIFHELLIYLNLAKIRLFDRNGTILGTKGAQMIKNNPKKTYYKMAWIDYLCRTDFRSTIKHGFILYLAVAMLAVPSALCSQQHKVMIFKMPSVELAMAPFAGPAASLTQSLDAESAIGASPETMMKASEAVKNAPPYLEHIMQAAEAYEVDPALIRAVIVAESSYNPQAVSNRGAQGLMQLMPSTAKSLGVENSFDPAMNIDGGARYLRQLLDRFDGDVRLALAAYNAGSRYVRKYRGVPPFKATRRYIKKVLKYQQKFQSEMAASAKVDPAV
jgi:hypothetical protein